MCILYITMRIGIDCRLFSQNFTGIGRYTHELVEHFIKFNDQQNRRHEIILFFNRPEYDNFTPPNLSVKKVLVNSRHYSFAEQFRFLFHLNKAKCDIVHFPHFNLPIFYHRPYIVTIHDLILHFFPGRKMSKFYQRIAYNLIIKNAVKKAKKIITVSDNTKNDLIKYLKVPTEKIQTIHNGISDIFTLLQDQVAIKKTLHKYKITPPFLLYTGVWRNHKNLPRLIKAFSLIRKNEGIDLRLVITGKEDKNYPEVKNTVKELDLTDSIIFTGLVEERELCHLYNAATITVCPSLYEGFGFPPLESMKCGTPVAASRTSSLPEVCGQNNAVFFDPYDIGDIARKITTLYKDAALQQDLVEKGFLHAAKFTWNASAGQAYGLLTHILNAN